MIYRGQLTVKEPGRPGHPIRLTRDPSWGDGPAILAGSQRMTGWSRGADHPKIPEPGAVWKARLDFAPRTLWMVRSDGTATRIPLARHPNWTSQPEDHKAQWFTWTNERRPFQPKEGFSANDARNLKGLAPDFVLGALIYSEFGWVMGTPYPARVGNYDPADGSVRFERWTGGGNASVIFRGMRYYLEDKPQYLDDPDGEFWFDKQGQGGVLYARLPGGTDPNTVRLEAGQHPDLVLGTEVQHLEISGLDFRWTTQPWDNTAYNFTVGSRRQSPHAGRNQYLGNVWQGLSERVFRHADPAKTLDDGNAADAGPQKERFAHESNVYARNVFYDIGQMGVFESSGRWLQTLDDFRAALRAQRSRVADLGVMDRAVPLRDPARGDFRLNRESLAVDQGAVVFVPWALFGVVAEWHFYPAGNDPAQVLDEHWYAKDYMTDRTEYHTRPTYPLTAVNVDRGDYIGGPLENFTAGALRLDPARKTYATIRHAALSQPFKATLATRANHGQNPQRQEFTFAGDDLKTAEIHASNFLLEVYFKADGDGLIIGKQQGTGYALELQGGRASFSVAGEGGVRAELISQARLADSQWHHLIAEADRAARTLTLYVDGKRDSHGPGIGKVSLANAGDLYVGGRPEGEHLSGALDFMRIAHGTLADAHTTIEELYAWQFDGPARRDLRGVKPQGQGRDAGALESGVAP